LQGNQQSAEQQQAQEEQKRWILQQISALSMSSVSWLFSYNLKMIEIAFCTLFSVDRSYIYFVSLHSLVVLLALQDLFYCFRSFLFNLFDCRTSIWCLFREADERRQMMLSQILSSQARERSKCPLKYVLCLCISVLFYFSRSSLRLFILCPICILYDGKIGDNCVLVMCCLCKIINVYLLGHIAEVSILWQISLNNSRYSTGKRSRHQCSQLCIQYSMDKYFPLIQSVELLEHFVVYS